MFFYLLPSCYPRAVSARMNSCRKSLPPSGTLKAVFFFRNYGAATDYASSIRITSLRKMSLSDGEIVFTADSNHGAAPFQPNGALPITITWIDFDHLRITYDSRMRVFQSATHFQNVQIEYISKT